MSDNKPTNIKLDGIEYAVGLNWIECAKGENLKYIHKRESKNKGGSVVTFDSDSNTIVGYCGEEQTDKTSLACATALYERDCLYVYKIDSLNKFWLNYVAPDGRLGSSMGDVLLDASEIIDIISQLLIIISSEPTNKLRIYSTSDTIKDLQDTLSEEMKFSIFGDNRILIQSFDIQSVTTGKFGSISRISKIDAGREISTVTLLVTSIVMVVAAASGYAYLSGDPEAYNEITSGSFSSSISKADSEFDKKVNSSGFEIFSTFNDNKTSTEFINKVESNIYSFDEIVDNIDMLSSLFPVYLVEWENNKVILEKDQDLKITYKVPYDRIPDSFGVYNEIESEIKQIVDGINTDQKTFKIYPNDIGKNSVTLDIQFKDSFDKKQHYNIEEAKEKLNESIKKIDADIKKSISRLKNIESETYELGFFSKRFSSQLDDLIYDAESISNQTIKKIKEKNKIYNDVFKVEKVEIPDEYYNLNRDVFLDVMQKNNHFKWTLSAASKTIPDVLAKYSDTSKRTKSKKAVKIVNPEILEIGYSWDFTVSSNGGETIGINGLKKLKELINNKSITIKNVEYDFNTQNWVLKGEFYEKK